MDDGSVLEALDVLFSLVEASLLLLFGWGALHQLDKVVTINFIHDAEHTPAVVTDPLQVLPFAGVGLGCGREDGTVCDGKRNDINTEKDKGTE